MSSVKYVAGEGNDNASIVVVGEAPGEEEDKQGRPFVGKSGQLLNEALAYIGYDRVEVYITNIVKVRPDNNRTPMDEEILSWRPTLIEEISQINPNIIITLGSCASKALLGDEIKITKDHGQIIHGKGPYPIIPIFHPSYILRGYGKKEEWFKDFEKAKNYVQGKR